MPEKPFNTPVATGKALANLHKIVREYESDTFSADATGLREYEIDQIIAALIDGIEEHLDGVRLSAILDEIRNS